LRKFFFLCSFCADFEPNRQTKKNVLLQDETIEKWTKELVKR
jgi:hypothetical protein